MATGTNSPPPKQNKTVADSAMSLCALEDEKSDNAPCDKSILQTRQYIYVALSRNFAAWCVHFVEDETTSLSKSVDWQCGKALAECLHHIFTSGTASDVTFLVGEDKTKISAHKIILISRSPVFYAMFEGLMPEQGDVIVPDIKEDIFKSFLGYLYTDKIALTTENVVPVLSVAMKYCVDIMIAVCEDFLLHNLTVDNVCTFLEEAHAFHIDKLTADCLQMIKKSAPASLRSESFAALCSVCMATVAKADDLDAEESDVYLALTKWAEAECARQNLEVTSANQRQVLGDNLFLARFNTMDLQFLLQRVFLDSILIPELAVDVVNFKMHQQTRLLSRNLTSRRRLRKEKIKVWRCSEPSYRYTHNESCSPETNSFSISCRAVLYGIGSPLVSSTSDVVVYKDNCPIKSENKLPIIKDTENVCEIVFTKPIFLTAGSTYTVVEKSSHKKHCIFESCVGKARFLNGVITFKETSHTALSCLYLILSKLDDYGQKTPFRGASLWRPSYNE
ncbi:BTB/POZ domain-containing protein 6-like [Pecten maximus]|uniref:BTB/POZ domain-containing protein 6-like n=1 Tax=Pecten maximus TaxID=6579 RepID=UPI0014581C7D|nr:BTB/POZ domain-containing protein 6-like [Pecten maximus]